MMERTGAMRISRGDRSPTTKESAMDNKEKTTCLMNYKAVRAFRTRIASDTCPSAANNV